jgi:hypothetical protein
VGTVARHEGADAMTMTASEAASYYPTIAAAARALGLPRETLRDQIRREMRAAGAGYIAPVKPFSLPDADEPIDDLIDRSCERYERRQKRRDAEAWVPINVPDEPGKPFAVLLMGDTHMDDDDCAWPLLRKHVQMVRDSEGVYAAFVGDSLNSWIGRLSRLYANQQTTKHDSLRLADWYFSTLGHKLLRCAYPATSERARERSLLPELGSPRDTQARQSGMAHAHGAFVPGHVNL